MRRTIVWAVLALASLDGPSDLPQAQIELREFSPGGSLRMALRVGDVRIIKGTDNQHIRLRYTPKSNDKDVADSDFARRVSLRFEVHGSEAEIKFEAPQGGTIDAVLEVPSPTNLDVKMRVGDLGVEGVEGNKDLQVHVGDIHVGLGSKPNYCKVDASTHIGDISQSLGRTKGWWLLGQSLKFRGDGQYQLHAHAGIGDIAFRTQ